MAPPATNDIDSTLLACFVCTFSCAMLWNNRGYVPCPYSAFNSSTSIYLPTFAAMNHRFLLSKMKSFGRGDVVVRWIEYLSGRVSRVHLVGEHSGAISMHSGVPQGSLVGPLLCLLFVNDLLETRRLLFEGDVKLVTRR